MKKIILSFALLTSLFVFVPVAHAETTQPTQQELQQQLISLLTQLIEQLKQQLATMIAEQNLNNQITQPIQPIQQPVASPVTVTPTPSNIPTETPVNTPKNPLANIPPVQPNYNFNVYETVYENVVGDQHILNSVNKDITVKKGFHLITISVVDGAVVTTDDPDMPSSFTLRPGSFYIGDHHQSGVIQDIGNITSCASVTDILDNDGCKPMSVGTFTFTFTNPQTGAYRPIKVTVNE